MLPKTFSIISSNSSSIQHWHICLLNTIYSSLFLTTVFISIILCSVLIWSFYGQQRMDRWMATAMQILKCVQKTFLYIICKYQIYLCCSSLHPTSYLLLAHVLTRVLLSFKVCWQTASPAHHKFVRIAYYLVYELGDCRSIFFEELNWSVGV